MKIGITGASGQLATATLRHLLSRVPASDIVAVTRNPEKVGGAREKGVEVRPGDFDDRRSLLLAFRKLDRLLMIPTSDTRTGVRTVQHLAAVDAAEECGVGHVAYISTVGAWPDGKDTLFESHFVTEQALIRTGMAWTFLRASLYAELLLGGAKRAAATGVYAAPVGGPIGYAARDDIAAAAAGILTTSNHGGKTYFATGPAAMGPLDVAAAISAAIGKPIRHTELTDEQVRQGMASDNVPADIIERLMDVLGNVRAGAFDLVSGDIARLSGKQPETVTDFLKRNLAALSAGA